MDRAMENTKEVIIKKEGMEEWSVMVQVLYKGPILTGQNQTLYQNLLLTDMNNTRSAAVIFNHDTVVLEDTLKLFEKYINLKCTFNPCARKIQDAKGLIIHRFPPVKQKNKKFIKAYTMIDQENIPILLRLWCEKGFDAEHEIPGLDNGPVFVIATNVGADTFYGLFLNSRYSTHLLIEPPVDGITELKNWYLDNVDQISEWKGHSIYRDLEWFFSPPKDEEILDVRTMAAQIGKLKTAWVRGDVEFIQTGQKPCHTMCGNCNKQLDKLPEQRTYCNSCNQWMITENRTKLVARIKDGNIILPTTLTSPDVDFLIEMTPNEVYQAQISGIDLHTKFTRGRKVVCFMKCFEAEYKSTRTTRYSTMKLFLDEYLRRLKRQAAEETSSVNTSTITNKESAEIVLAINKESTPQATVISPTQEMLFEKGNNSNIQPTGSGHSVKAKRRIQFGTIDDTDLTTEEKEPEHQTGKEEDSNNPNKKMKQIITE